MLVLFEAENVVANPGFEDGIPPWQGKGAQIEKKEREGQGAKLDGGGSWAKFRYVVFPEIRMALVTGMTLAFARGLGEYGSVVFIAGNMPMRTEITPLLIMIQLEQYEYASATAIAFAFLLISFALLFSVNAISWKRGAARERP